MIRDIIEKVKGNSDTFKAIQKYIVKTEQSNNKTLVYVNFEDADTVDELIKKDKKLAKSLNVKDSSGDHKVYYFDNVTEADGGYGDLGVIPSAPSNVGDKKNKEKELMIVDGEIRSEDKK